MADSDIAIVGLSAHLPGARDAEAYWRNLVEGVESIRELPEEELLEAGVPREELHRPGYVRAAATLDGVYDFDAEFFGLSPKEAGIMDPQHRHFLMAAWEALEDAAHVPANFDGAIGVFAGCGMGNYFMRNLLTNQELVRDVGLFLLRHTGNDKDFLSTRASYTFDLRGPSVNVQTACSTSLVATHLAVQHLLTGECDLALAGGVTIEVPHAHGYHYQEGEVLSPDGHCRAFDHRSQGTVFGSGVGVVALRRLEDALADGDRIYAVIKGTAVNNDGSLKVGYLAPSVDGQAACISEALAVADVEPESIGYVECHGTGTPMGDPIEIAGLSQAFAGDEELIGTCRVGSVKTNIGHLDTAAGVASLIKTSLSLHHGALPATLHFEKPNPNLEIEQSPFVVNDRLTEWPRQPGAPRRAGVNSLGVGGTNAFAVLEEAPEPIRTPSSGGWRLLTLSARNRAALDANSARLAAHLRAHDDLDLADVAWTLHEGRHHFGERRVVAARSVEEAAGLLEAGDPRRVFTHTASTTAAPSFTFMFPGGGVQHPRMGAGLHASEPTFAAHVDEGLRLLETVHGLDLRPMLFAPDDQDEDTVASMAAMSHQLPLIFIVEYALAQLLLSWGLQPTALVGHSLGENTAACVAGTISFEDCLGLVVLRGRLMDQVAGGAIAVPLPSSELEPLLAPLDLDLAVQNSSDLCVVSGAADRLAQLADQLREQGVDPVPVPVTTPVHSRLLDVVLPEFRAYLESITLHPPTLPWVSNLTGTWIEASQATDPGYWVDHLRSTVRFADCISSLVDDPSRILLEVGPGVTLTSLVRMHPDAKSGQAPVATMRHADDAIDDDAALLGALGRIWAAGGTLDIERLFSDGPRRRVGLPTYAFQTQTFFIAPGTAGTETSSGDAVLDRVEDESRWAWKPVWKSQDREEAVEGPIQWLVIVDRTGLGDRVVARLRGRGDDVVVVRTGDSYRAISDEEYVLSPELGAPGYDSLVRDLVRTGRVPDRIAHLALLATDDREFRPGSSFFHRNQELGFQSLVFLAQAWANSGVRRPLHVAVATMGAQAAPGSEPPQWPEQSTVLGPVRVIPRELPDVTVSTFDLDPSDLAAAADERPALRLRARRAAATVAAPSILDEVVDELLAPPVSQVVAIRGDRRYVQDVRHVRLPEPGTGAAPLRRGGAVLVTGGLGGIGLTIAEHLYETAGARLALLSRSPLPPRDRWDDTVDRLGPTHPTSERIHRIRQLEAGGAEVLLLSGDVTDPEAVGRATEEVRARFGGIHGVVHAAGVIDDALLLSKSQAAMEDVLAPKVYGTLVLESATAADDLDLFVVFSSTSTVTAPIGQVDYVAANAFLNAFAESRHGRGDHHVRAIDWGVWNEVGMAVEAAARTADADDEVTTSPAAHPFFEERSRSVDGVIRLSARWDPQCTWLLDEHRTAAHEALVPGAAYLELARGALAEVGFTAPFEIRDLTFLRPLAVADGTVGEVEVVLTPTVEGYGFEVRQRVTVDQPTAEDGPATGRSGWRATGQASLLLHDPESVAPLDLDAQTARLPNVVATRTHQQDHLRFGPRWDVVRRVQAGPGASMAWLHLDDAYVEDLDGVGLHPALVDLGTGFAMDLVEGYTGDRLWVPVSYRRIRVFDRLPQDVVARAVVRRGSTEANGFATFDVLLCDVDGKVLLAVDGFTIKRLDGTLDLGIGRRVLASEVEFDPVPRHARQRTRSELAFQHNLTQGIRPDEGKRLFARALSAEGLPVVYLTSLDLAELRRQSDVIAASQLAAATSDASAVFSRPQLDSELVEPRNDVEATLVAMWQDLLGIDQIGVRDNFFDLGGHSLIAVRLFAQVKRTFSVDFPISILFEAPTVEACAELIAEAMPAESAESDGAGSDGEGPTSTIAAPRPRFTHLVAMHPGEGTGETPFFLVAGMFGNVLNLRHLAHQIGTDRPFYGVQARGLYGDDVPHEDFVEMASDYLAEIRAVQPYGPYLLGGFSGGGIAAYEMAQQLRAAGEEVALLVLLDTPLPFDPPLTPRDRAQIQLDRLRERGPAYVREWAVNRVAWERERRRRARGPEVPSDDGALHSTVVEAAFYRALEAYDLKPYPGVVTLYRPKLTPLHVFGPDRQIDVNRRFVYHDNGWGPYCERVDVSEVPGTHDSMVLEPAVRVLAGRLRAAIAEAAQERGSQERVADLVP